MKGVWRNEKWTQHFD